ncbi:MAG: hypothetical protein H0W42_00100 [Gemmatimonadaceae bacterium]|nr:hypothetical protein [Gemmatimonadaceae bacterium]
MTTTQELQGADGRTQRERPPVPRLRDVLRAQLRATGFALRVPVVLAAAFAVLATLNVVLGVISRDGVTNIHAEPSPLPGFIGALLPLAVWAREEHFGAGFLWTLPVDRRRHALIKVLAGWLWMMGGVALYALWLLVLALVSGGEVLPVESLMILSAPGRPSSPVDPALLQTVQWAPGLLIWAVPFAMATATYLCGSALVLGIHRPLRWVVGAVIVFAVASTAAHLASPLLGLGWLEGAPESVVSRLFEGRYGLEALITLRTWSLDTRATLTTGEVVQIWSAVPDLHEWVIAAALWTGAGLLALWAAASRHRERRA